MEIFDQLIIINSMRSLLLLLFLCYCSNVSAQVKLTGYVIEMSTAQPIKGATVFIHNEFNIAFNPPIQTQTNEHGYYEFSNINPGKYSVNAFVLYELMGDTLAYVYQPGILTVENIDYSALRNTIGLNFAFSKNEFEFQYHLKESVQSGNMPDLDASIYTVFRFLKPRVETSLPSFKRSETTFIEKKSW